MARLISSGSLVEGVTAADFRLPAGTALRFERPAEAIRPFVASYVAFDSNPDYVAAGQEWMLPTGAQIWVVLTRGAISVRIGRRQYPSIPSVLLYGPTSRAMAITSQGGLTIGIEVSPLGWARLIDRSAETLRDQLVPLETAASPEFVADLATTLAHLNDEEELKTVLDDVFARHLTKVNRDEPLITRVMYLIADGDLADCTSACAAHGIAPRVAARIARQYFGFPMKLLMMRVRFLRALTSLLDGDCAAGFLQSYYDRSHFLRDARRFLGMTPRQYLAHQPVYVTAACRARRLVLGAPVASMDVPPDLAPAP